MLVLASATRTGHRRDVQRRRWPSFAATATRTCLGPLPDGPAASPGERVAIRRFSCGPVPAPSRRPRGGGRPGTCSRRYARGERNQQGLVAAAGDEGERQHGAGVPRRTRAGAVGGVEDVDVAQVAAGLVVHAAEDGPDLPSWRRPAAARLSPGRPPRDSGRPRTGPRVDGPSVPAPIGCESRILLGTNSPRAGSRRQQRTTLSNPPA